LVTLHETYRVSLQADSEYPSWLWDLLKPDPTLAELTPKDYRYWKLTNRLRIKELNQMQSKK
jgi:hypothetical protein